MSTHNTPALFDSLDVPVDRPPIVRGPQWIAGIDPGLTGAIALLADGEEPHRYVMPIWKEKKKVQRRIKGSRSTKTGISVREHLDLKRIREILSEYAIRRAFLEIQQPHNKPEPQRCDGCGKIVTFASPQGLTSTFTTGRNWGLLEGVLIGLGVDYEHVHPLTWQPKLLPPGVGETKARAIAACKELFPTVDLHATSRCTTDHVGIADAVLLAEFGRRRLAGEPGDYDPELGF